MVRRELAEGDGVLERINVSLLSDLSRKEFKVSIPMNDINSCIQHASQPEKRGEIRIFSISSAPLGALINCRMCYF